jgi:hypothetical protein
VNVVGKPPLTTVREGRLIASVSRCYEAGNKAAKEIEEAATAIATKRRNNSKQQRLKDKVQPCEIFVASRWDFFSNCVCHLSRPIIDGHRIPAQSALRLESRGLRLMLGAHAFPMLAHARVVVASHLLTPRFNAKMQ